MLMQQMKQKYVGTNPEQFADERKIKYTIVKQTEYSTLPVDQRIEYASQARQHICRVINFLSEQSPVS